jgi:hypothetical protein
MMTVVMKITNKFFSFLTSQIYSSYTHDMTIQLYILQDFTKKTPLQQFFLEKRKLNEDKLKFKSTRTTGLVSLLLLLLVPCKHKCNIYSHFTRMIL